ncbi:hypothetical protein C1645_882973 [Glomus cerebriforme]|uniref:Uncharacterized protein n=1 Tax=Glomus cerebriforme TaxID=658196 RepID=A0A397S3C7_9GLOM|nr:hypothetical protein C1645_882973 [Glomus cerebriforme]
MVFNYCKQLESIEIWPNDGILNEKELLNIVAKFSPKNFCKLKYTATSELLPEELESFFIKEIMKIIEKYIKLGVIEKFEILC